MATNIDETFNIVDKIIITATETYDNFIFEYIKPWCELKTHHVVSKRLLIRALTEFQKNHPEEFNLLNSISMKETHNENI